MSNERKGFDAYSDVFINGGGSKPGGVPPIRRGEGRDRERAAAVNSELDKHAIEIRGSAANGEYAVKRLAELAERVELLEKKAARQPVVLMPDDVQLLLDWATHEDVQRDLRGEAKQFCEIVIKTLKGCQDE